jgi:hypothetical protein
VNLVKALPKSDRGISLVGLLIDMPEDSHYAISTLKLTIRIHSVRSIDGKLVIFPSQSRQGSELTRSISETVHWQDERLLTCTFSSKELVRKDFVERVR